ncbi:hypothetical protein COCC4DRAFT_26348 [Bipolaris maydis ATCC 48331]|uniref:Protein kinase domain-containing protein n=2 Tax=Cochliobolus heterostrophus TaxID=5016 RepID=M2V4Q4_COCH5|nr:uncharacterized protein COCC4DRAFT_26348 [Bipolaris maydis ATCC 48331]EMD94988.1 hypothetical protein COCHEDRAFT_1027499 [Bipolaris maydis C5]KAJ5029378.1 kinase-like domain-containing protein [Bipolaris maydis]ENI01721.1 hypothetical protein COCC4DRAFT_26348 [Bipolaris maydis ATCC 48331]KAJ6214854.1 kinase-like domain-containing protein [Bipolaris maydis]KAJ6287147.1 kinase-like domain-containing protein [Bipolaris maydis]
MATTLRLDGPRVTPHGSENVEEVAQKTIVSYATRALVPYRRDEEHPYLHGGQATVFRATKTLPSSGLRRKVDIFAIKEIPIGDRKARHRLRKEIEHLRLCQHPNVLQLKKAQASLQRLLEEIANSRDGMSRLCPWYKSHGLDPWPSVVWQCVLGLEHLRKNKIRHKDLKPDKILLVDESDGASLDPKVRAVIADLGISKGYVEAENTTFNGTEQYLAPEQKAQASSTYRSDIFFARLQHLMDPCPSKLEAVGAVPGERTGFNEVPPLLEQLRQNLDDNKQPDTVGFLVTLEDIITSTLLEQPDERLSLQSILAKLDDYDASWLQSGSFKMVDLCITSGNHTQVLEIDFSFVTNDAEAFKLIRKHYSKAIFYHNLDWLRWPEEVYLIKFSSANAFEVLECTSTLCKTSLHAGGYHDDPIREGRFDGRLLIDCLEGSFTCDPALSDHQSGMLPKRRVIIHHHRDGSKTISTIQGPRLGVHIVKTFPFSVYSTIVAFSLAPFVVGYLIYYSDQIPPEGIIFSLFVYFELVIVPAVLSLFYRYAKQLGQRLSRHDLLEAEKKRDQEAKSNANLDTEQGTRWESNTSCQANGLGRQIYDIDQGKLILPDFPRMHCRQCWEMNGKLDSIPPNPTQGTEFPGLSEDLTPYQKRQSARTLGTSKLCVVTIEPKG